MAKNPSVMYGSFKNQIHLSSAIIGLSTTIFDPWSRDENLRDDILLILGPRGLIPHSYKTFSSYPSSMHTIHTNIQLKVILTIPYTGEGCMQHISGSQVLSDQIQSHFNCTVAPLVHLYLAVEWSCVELWTVEATLYNLVCIASNHMHLCQCAYDQHWQGVKIKEQIVYSWIVTILYCSGT